ncbi:MAG TPA: lysine biosynthesis protein LysX [Candidatus Saccharimonadales bacterium]|nr:lysine biosynthesis protein LysX [Candidatus Saccharimonadales bacterium]
MSQLRIGMVCSRVRVEEKLLLEAFARYANVEVIRVDDDQFQAPLAGLGQLSEAVVTLRSCHAVLMRCLSHVRQVTIARVLEAWGIVTVNRSAVLETCGDKLQTTLALAAAGVPTPAARVAFTVQAGLEAVDALGYPCVVKPVTGSWGRLVARLNDRDAAEAVLEHKDILGGALHRVVYLQAHVDKPGRDLRAFVIGDRTVAAIGRRSAHWVTNTARGAVAERVKVTPQLDDICRCASAAVGGGALAVDLLEGRDALLVNEVNATMEFRNSVGPTGVDIPALLAEHVLDLAAAPT